MQVKTAEKLYFGKTKILAECAIMCAAASVLSLIKIYEAPLGGSVTLFSMVPILLIAFRHGLMWGYGTAFVYSVIQLLFGLSSVAWVQTPEGIVLCILFDYIFAFTVIGTAAVFNKIKTNTIIKVLLGSLTACLLRFIMHVVSGAVVWYSITKEGQWNDLVNKFGMWTYSIIYNAQYMIPEIIITLTAASAVVTILNVLNKNHIKKA